MRNKRKTVDLGEACAHGAWPVARQRIALVLVYPVFARPGYCSHRTISIDAFEAIGGISNLKCGSLSNCITILLFPSHTDTSWIACHNASSLAVMLGVVLSDRQSIPDLDGVSPLFMFLVHRKAHPRHFLLLAPLIAVLLIKLLNIPQAGHVLRYAC